MKTVFLRYWCALLLLGTVIPSMGQNNLRYGTSAIPAVVRAPYTYYDVLRVSSKGWLQQTFNTTASAWEDYEKTKNLKNADGDFTEIDTKYWVDGSSSWETEYQTNYQYQKDANNKVIEMIFDVQSAFDTYTVRYIYTYDQNRLSEVEVAFKSGGTFFPSTHSFIKYNNLGQRVKDSLVDVNTAEAVSSREYEYDNNGNCIKELGWGKMVDNSWDTTMVAQQEYFAGGKLKRRVYGFQNAQGDIMENFYDEYTYTNTGNVDVYTTFIKQNATSPANPFMYYKHYYNGQNKLQTIVSKTFSLAMNRWNNDDSILLNYVTAGGAYDTSYIHTGANNGIDWSANPTDRLVFEKNATGIKQVASSKLNMNAYPNPAATELFVEISTIVDVETTLTLTDLTGKVLKTTEVDLLTGQANTIKMDLSGIPQGLYLLHAGNQTVKLVKE